jgi:hypothetical protein
LPSIIAFNQISFTLKRSDEIDSLIAGKFSKMVATRAEAFELMRREPLKVINE